MIYNTFRKGWFLRLKTERGIEKLPFNRDANQARLRDFVRRAQEELGIRVELVAPLDEPSEPQ